MKKHGSIVSFMSARQYNKTEKNIKKEIQKESKRSMGDGRVRHSGRRKGREPSSVPPG